MAQPGPQAGLPPGITPQQIQQMIAMEAQKRGMSVAQFQALQKQAIEQEAAKAGMTPQQFIQLKQAAAREHVEAKPEAIALAKFLRSQNLKTRTCIFNGQRKDMFKVKRAIRALQSPAYEKARTKNALLPAVIDETSAKAALALLPLSMLALRVSKADPHAGHNHGPGKKEKRIKGLWTVKIEQQQTFEPLMHYVWLYEPQSWTTKLWGGLLILAIFAVVLFPLWPLFMRRGVWYLSVGMMFLLAAFFAMAIFRLILFIITYFAVPPGLWLFPNLFEDVGFFESFVPLAATGTSTTTKEAPTTDGSAVTSSGDAAPDSAAARRHAAPTVEEAEE
ncbi:hypothetical protein DV738_g4357, partial [Chaetothyriales sp. CBS 135597]